MIPVDVNFPPVNGSDRIGVDLCIRRRRKHFEMHAADIMREEKDDSYLSLGIKNHPSYGQKKVSNSEAETFMSKSDNASWM